MIFGLTSSKSLACAGWTMEQDRETAPFPAHYITEARLFQAIRFHHSLNDPLVIVPND